MESAVPAPPAGTSVVTLAGTITGLHSTWTSLRGQTDPRWQWIVILPEDVTEPDWLVRARAEDPRVRVQACPDAGPGGALADAVALVEGEVLLSVAPGDVLASRAVATLATTAITEGWAYTDEMVGLGGNAGSHVWLKPASCPEWWRTHPPMLATAALSRAALVSVGGLRPGMGTAAWYDAVLRISEGIAGVHMDEPLLHRPDGDVWRGLTAEDAAAAVRSHCERVGIHLTDVTPIVVRGRRVGQRLHRRLTGTPSVSIVVPTRGSSSVVDGRSRCHVVELVRSVWTQSRYVGLTEVVVVHDEPTPPEVLQELSDVLGDALVLVPFDEPFNFSRKCNFGALAARGEYLCFLNDDVEVISPGWLDELVAHLAEPHVGAVGGRLLFADGTLQHIGHQYDGGHAGHPLLGWPADTLALGGAAQLAAERSGVTAACLLVRAGDFSEVGGFSEILPLNYNDVDFCLKIRRRGQSIRYTPHAELFHFESQTRVPRLLSWERGVVHRRWSGEMRADRYLRTEALADYAELEPNDMAAVTPLVGMGSPLERGKP
jgi:GT2 family glycosyltransferase